MKFFMVLLFGMLVGSCLAETELHPQPMYQHYRWCWSTFYRPTCFPTIDQCVVDAESHELDLVTPCRRERYFTHER